MKQLNYLLVGAAFIASNATAMENAHQQAPQAQPEVVAITLDDVIRTRLERSEQIVVLTPAAKNNLNKALADACARGNIQEVFQQLQNGAEPAIIPEYDHLDQYFIPVRGVEGGVLRPARENYGIFTPLQLAALYHRKEVVEKIVKFQKERKETAYTSLLILLRLQSEGNGGGSTLIKLLIPYIKPYAQSVYSEVEPMLQARCRDGKRAFELLPVDCLVPKNIGLKEWAGFKYNQARFQITDKSDATVKAIEKFAQKNPHVPVGPLLYAGVPITAVIISGAACYYYEWEGLVPTLKVVLLGATSTKLIPELLKYYNISLF